MHVVVVGASLAGVRTVQALRRLGCAAHITLVDSQPRVACDRPPLSKGYLADPSAAERPVITNEQLADLNVEPLLGQRAVSLDTNARTIGLHNGRFRPYDVLVIASGSSPRTIPGLTPRNGLHVLRTAEDASAIRSALADGARTIIIGGGFIGAEVAWTARSMGREVTVVEPMPALMVRGLGPTLSTILTRRHADGGVRLRLGVGVLSVEGNGRVEAVRLSDGTELAADLVVLGVGAVPETGWLRGSGLDISDGVRCDERLAAIGAEGVYAAGDVARWLHPRYGEYVRVDHWTNAVEHGPVVATNICGTPTAYDALPYVWSDQLGSRLQVVGRVRPGDEVRFVHGGPDAPTFVAITGVNDRLHAVVGLGAVRELMPFRRLLVEGATWQDALDLAGAAAASP